MWEFESPWGHHFLLTSYVLAHKILPWLVYSKFYMLVILSLLNAANQPSQGAFAWLSSFFSSDARTASQATTSTTQLLPGSQTVKNFTPVMADAQQQTIADLHRQLDEVQKMRQRAEDALVSQRDVYEGQLAASRHQLSLLQQANASSHEQIGALRQNTKECLGIVAAMFDKTKSQDYVAGLLAGFMTRLSEEEQRIFGQIQTKIDTLAAEKAEILVQIEKLRNETSEQAKRLLQEKEAAVRRIQVDIDKLTREKDQQQRESEERKRQIEGLQRQLEESSFYHQVAKNKLNRQLTREGLIHMAHNWVTEETRRSTDPDTTRVVNGLNPFYDDETTRKTNTFLNMLLKNTSREHLKQCLSEDTFALLTNNFALNQCVACLRGKINTHAIISASEIAKALEGQVIVWSRDDVKERSLSTNAR